MVAAPPRPAPCRRYRTVTLVPKSQAGPADYRAAVDPAVLDDTTCMAALLSHTQCAPEDLGSGGAAAAASALALSPACCAASRAWAEGGCWCSASGRALVGALPPLMGNAMITAVARLCRVQGSARARTC